MKNIFKSNLKFILVAALMATFAAGCEDLPPTEYVEHTYVEAFLIVGEPIGNIRVVRSQPLDVEYSLENAFIHDADVRLIKGEEEIALSYRNEGMPEYYDPQGRAVEAGAEYRLEINLADGKRITGRTLTPTTFNWVVPPKKYMHFPQDTLKMPEVDSVAIEWEPAQHFNFYLLTVKCLDTLEYGKYLDPPTAEMNRRAYTIFRNMDNFYDEPAYWTIMGNNRTATVWNAFKWFGPHEIAIFRPDYNMLRWFLQYQNMQGEPYNDMLGSVEGDGIGCFGSASVVRDTSFVYKNRP